MRGLCAGTGRADISAPPGTPQGGWGAQLHQRGTGTDLPLVVSALVLSDGEETAVAIADVDIIHLTPEVEAKAVAKAVELTSIPASHIRISHSHTHSGPNTFRLSTISEGLPMALEYIETLPSRIAAAIWQASRHLRPVRYAAGIGSCDINVNRRYRTPDGQVVVGCNPTGTVDRAVRVVRFDDSSGRTVATIIHYACHPTTMGWQNDRYTPDYPGMARRVVEEQLGGTCIFLQGATGNLGPREGFTGDLEVYRRLGRILGLNASAVALNLESSPRKYRFAGIQESGAKIALYEAEEVETPAPVLRVISRKIALPVRETGDPAQMEAAAAAMRERLNQARDAGSEADLRLATALATQAQMRANLAKMTSGKAHLERRLMGIRIGAVALISTQGEPFIEISQAIEKASPFPFTLFSGYSHGGDAYIPTPEAYEEGGYEVGTTVFAPEAAGILIAQSITMLRELEGE